MFAESKERKGPEWAEPLREFARKHRVWFAIGFFTLLLIVTQLPHVVFGATPDRTEPGVFRPHICRPSGTPDDVCLWSTAVEVQKWREGYFDKKSGFNPSVVFAAPAASKEIIVDKITTKLKNQGTALPASCQGSERCYAYQLYGEIVSDASCVTKGVPTNQAHTCARTPESSITKQGVINGISVVLCGGVIALGIFTKATSSLMAGAGGAVCTWDLWKDSTQ
jgi:hypothetical protein